MALNSKEAKVIRGFAEAIEGFVNSEEGVKNTEASLKEKKLALSKLLEGVLLLISKGQNRVITLLLRESPEELGKQVKKDFHDLRQQVSAELLSNLADGSNNDDFVLELIFTSTVNKVRQLAQRLRDAVADLPNEKSAETEQNAISEKLWKRILTWVKKHPHSYGLTGGFVCLISLLVLGLFKVQWRNWCWGTAGLAFIVLILSLLGGKSRAN